MPKVTYAIAVLALAMMGALAASGRTSGQDGAPAKGANDATRKEGLPAAVVGVIDMDAVFKGYHKVEFVRSQIESEATAKKVELTRYQTEAQQVAKVMEQLQPGTPDYKANDTKLTKLQADYTAAREQAQRDFALREAEALAMIYKEIQAMVDHVAKFNRMNYVLRVSNEPVSGADPQSALAAMSRSVVWSDGRSDITSMVVILLNQQYEKAGGQRAPSNNTSAPVPPSAPTDPATRAAAGNSAAGARPR